MSLFEKLKNAFGIKSSHAPEQEQKVAMDAKKDEMNHDVLDAVKTKTVDVPAARAHKNDKKSPDAPKTL